jgi:hypothetical protein
MEEGVVVKVSVETLLEVKDENFSPENSPLLLRLFRFRMESLPVIPLLGNQGRLLLL